MDERTDNPSVEVDADPGIVVDPNPSGPVGEPGVVGEPGIPVNPGTTSDPVIPSTPGVADGRPNNDETDVPERYDGGEIPRV